MRNRNRRYLNQPLDVSKEFSRDENDFFLGMSVEAFDSESASGTLRWERHALRHRMSFNQLTPVFQRAPRWSENPSSFEDDRLAEEFPVGEYDKDPVLPFSLSFVTPRTVRIRISTHPVPRRDAQSLMLCGEPGQDGSWTVEETGDGITYSSKAGSVRIEREPWRIDLRDARGSSLTKTQNFQDGRSLINSDPTPFSFVRSAEDLSRRIAATFSLAPDEKLYGCGESFTRLNKRGQKIPIWTSDAHGVQTSDMYKPIPFFLSSQGYGMFVHTSAPLTFDFGCSYDGANTIYLGDDELDLFVFFGTPKEILAEYTALTGRSPVPPLWSFGLWMSRITYESEEEAREVARGMREQDIPCDVIHLDTGWFEEDWRCNYKFAPSRFNDPRKMISDLRQQGFRISLWQLPYFTPRNELYKEALEGGYAVLGADGRPPTEDVVIDFSNPEAVEWYQSKLAGLLNMGVAAIKVDFGEAAPLHGVYASGKSGFYEHNLYPLRYNKAAAEIVKKITGESIIWARSTWAGSQRYPVHWGGDAENTDSAMAATLRAGLSLGLCGFSFWSHDIGGFVSRTPRELYRRWMPFGMLTSHSRCHGVPPKEPWHYDEEFTDDFRRAVELKYRLMPYVYTQAHECSKKGYPMLRTLFFEYPEDPASWLVEDEYMFGESLLVAPLMHESSSRHVYLPPGEWWIDYQSGEAYEGGRWYAIEAGEIPAVVLVRAGSAIPHARVAQSTEELDWRSLELRVFASGTTANAEGKIFLPERDEVASLHLERSGSEFTLYGAAVDGVDWTVHAVGS